MSKKQNSEISPEVKKWLTIAARVIGIILAALIGDTADVVSFLNF